MKPTYLCSLALLPPLLFAAPDKARAQQDNEVTVEPNRVVVSLGDNDLAAFERLARETTNDDFVFGSVVVSCGYLKKNEDGPMSPIEGTESIYQDWSGVSLFNHEPGQISDAKEQKNQRTELSLARKICHKTFRQLNAQQHPAAYSLK